MQTQTEPQTAYTSGRYPVPERPLLQEPYEYDLGDRMREEICEICGLPEGEMPRLHALFHSLTEEVA